MIIIRYATACQIKKLSKHTSMADLRSHSLSCGGECWDCDSCGGSITH